MGVWMRELIIDWLARSWLTELANWLPDWLTGLTGNVLFRTNLLKFVFYKSKCINFNTRKYQGKSLEIAAYRSIVPDTISIQTDVFHIRTGMAFLVGSVYVYIYQAWPSFSFEMPSGPDNFPSRCLHVKIWVNSVRWVIW